MKLNKYGAIGMMEWQLNLQAGKATVHIEFKGGFENEYGIHPATFMTKDPIIQNIIERSSYFACGKIVLLESKDLGMSAEEIVKAKRRADAQARRMAEANAKEAEAKAATEAKAKAEQEAAAQQAKAEEEQKAVTDEPTDDEDADTYDVGDDNAPADNEPSEEDTASDDGETPEGELTVVNVSCNQDAKDYLEEHFGAQSGLRNWENILACGKVNGILFVKE